MTVAPVEEVASTEPDVPSRWAQLLLKAAGTRRPRAVIGLALVGMLITLICALLVVGAWRDDKWIDSRTGHGIAQVLSVAFDRTAVRFDTPDGAVHIPVDGVLYPQGLEAGERVKVEYDLTQPDALVRVEGRNYTLTFLPVGMILAVTWASVGGLIWWLRRPTERTPATK